MRVHGMPQLRVANKSRNVHNSCYKHHGTQKGGVHQSGDPSTDSPAACPRKSLGMGAYTHPSGPSSPSTLGRCQNTMVPLEPSPPRSTNTRRSWSISLPVLDSGVEPTSRRRSIAHAASSKARDRAGPRPRAVGPTTQPGTSTAASLKDIRLFKLLDSLVPISCPATAAQKEATFTQLCNTSRHADATLVPALEPDLQSDLLRHIAHALLQRKP
jgi:hypothetical protein